MTEINTIVVIGAGIIGLTAAHRLLDVLNSSKFKIVIVAKEWPTSIPGSPTTHSINYASMWAGAHIRPIPASTPQLAREASWVKQACQVFEEHHGALDVIGVTKCKGIELLETPPASYTQQTPESFSVETGLRNYRQYDQAELPEGVELGYEYDTFCINAPVYCASLLRSFIVRGGRCLDQHLSAEKEAFAVTQRVCLVVNASGVGFGDKQCFPIRGQTVLTDLEPATKTVTKQCKDGSWSFIIPRFYGGGTIIGGTKEPNDWTIHPDISTRETLLQETSKIVGLATKTDMSSTNINVIADIVGRRPAREGGMRVEIEYLEDSSSGQGRAGCVVHAYGAGGRGFEISWGVAAEVTRLIETVLSQSAIKARL